MRPLTLVFLILVVALPLHAQEPTPASSPSGEIVFVSTRDGSSQIYVLDLATSSTRQLTRGNVHPTWPRWSPDGAWIVYDALGANGREIFVMDGNGENRRQLTDNNVSDNLPIWSPDGAQVVFGSTRAGNRHLFIMDAADGANVQQITTEEAFYDAMAWLPGTDQIAVNRLVGQNQAEVYLVDVTDGSELRLTEWDSNDLLPQWSPDSTQLVWASNRNGFDQLFRVDYDALLAAAPIQNDPTLIEQITHGGTGIQGQSYFDFSPDGAYVVVSGLINNESPFDNVQSNLYLFDLEARTYTQLTDDGGSTFPDWRPESR